MGRATYSSVEEKMIYCPHCQKPSIGKKGICPHCGKRLPRPKPKPKAKPKPRPKLKLKSTTLIAPNSQSTKLPVSNPLRKRDPSAFEMDATVIAHGANEQAEPEEQQAEPEEQQAEPEVAKPKTQEETKAVKPRMRIGEILVGAGALLVGHLKAALNIQKTSGLRLGTILVEENLVSESHLVQALAYQADLPWVDLENREPSKELLELIPSSVAKNYLFFPVDAKPTKDGKSILLLAMDNPLDTTAIHAAAARTSMRVKPVFAVPSAIRAAIESFFEEPRTDSEEQEDEDSSADSTASPQASPVKDNVGQRDIIVVSTRQITMDFINKDDLFEIVKATDDLPDQDTASENDGDGSE